MPIKRDTKKKTFCTSSKIFLKSSLQDNNWAGKSVMKPVYDMAFQKINSIREGSNYKSDNF